MNTSFRQRANRQRRDLRRPAKPTIVAAALFVVFHLVAWFAGPEQLPFLIQRLVGLTGAALALLVVVFGFNEFAVEHKSFPRPSRRGLDWTSVAGFSVFVLVLAWWLGPWAPIKVDHSDAGRARPFRGKPEPADGRQDSIREAHPAAAATGPD
jgi:hypothetical protein